MNKKSLGSYYTPKRLANFIANYCMDQMDSQTISILEPSVGDGIFVEAINESNIVNNFNSVSLEVIEREKEELKKAIQKNTNKNISLKARNQDYLFYHNKISKRYSLIIGNPPYVKSTLLTEHQKKLALNIHLEQNLSSKRINNIWTAFVVSAITKLEDDGILAFVLPLELLQVKFTEEIRELLKRSFSRLEIFMFDELQFKECKGQDTVLLVGYKQHNLEGTFYTTIDTLEDLECHNFVLQQNTTVSDSDKKWTHHFITPDEYAFLENLKSQLNCVHELVDNKAGIVTAANDYFIVNEKDLKKNRFIRYGKPIIRKGAFVNGSVTFNFNDFKKLSSQNKPAYLLDFNLANPKRLSKGVQNYIEEGEVKKIHLRTKCKKREYWYQVPNIMEHGEAFFFKRAHEYPKLLKNEAKIHATDSAYLVKTKDGVFINDFIFSFYNSLTLAYAELEGRYYGGGVLELTPNEFRAIPIPLVSVKDFDEYSQVFAQKASLNQVLNRYNYRILKKTLGVNKEEILRIENIRKKLVQRRMNRKSH